MNTKFNFFSETDNMEYNFIKTPKAILYDKKYSSLSNAAKLLYLAMLERQSLSLKNKWKDEAGNIYIIFTHEDARQILGCGENKIVKTFSELDTENGIGLIKRKRRGLCKPDIIYLSSAILNGNSEQKATKSNPSQLYKEENRNFENESSVSSENKAQELSITKSNNIKNNKNKINNINSSFFSPEKLTEERSEQKEAIKFNIDYDTLIKTYSKDIIDEIVATMTNAVCSTKDFISISGENIPTKEIKEKFLSMDQFHIEYVCDSLNRNTTDVKNINSYLLTCLYRAADNISIHYQLMANHDLSQEKKSKTQSGFYS